MLSHASNLLVWDIETVPDLKGFAAANGHAARAMTKFEPNWATSSPSTSITRSSASARWLPIVKKMGSGPWMRSGHRTLGSDPGRG
jgi:hypothetical protein